MKNGAGGKKESKLKDEEETFNFRVSCGEGVTARGVILCYIFVVLF